jgi:hypothetical protein
LREKLKEQLKSKDNEINSLSANNEELKNAKEKAERASKSKDERIQGLELKIKKTKEANEKRLGQEVNRQFNEIEKFKIWLDETRVNNPVHSLVYGFID